MPIDVADLDILSAREGCSANSGEATVGFIAKRLHVDPSRASRIVADAVDLVTFARLFTRFSIWVAEAKEGAGKTKGSGM